MYYKKKYKMEGMLLVSKKGYLTHFQQFQFYRDGQIQRLAVCHWQASSHNVVSSTPRTGGVRKDMDVNEDERLCKFKLKTQIKVKK